MNSRAEDGNGMLALKCKIATLITVSLKNLHNEMQGGMWLLRNPFSYWYYSAFGQRLSEALSRDNAILA